jgi:hypothetical protein
MIEQSADEFWNEIVLRLRFDKGFEQNAVGFRVGRSRGIDPAGRVEHDRTSPIRRSLVVRDGVLTVSENGVKASSLATLAERGFVAFPPQ